MKNPTHGKRKDARATRAKVLAAAAEVVATEGPSALTLARAADVAGVSKGAVLYHFATKNDLVAAMMEILFEQFEVLAAQSIERDQDAGGRYTRAYARAAFDPRFDTPTAASGLLAAVATDSALLQSAVKQHARYQKLLEGDEIPRAVATLVRLAADGLYFTRAFGLAPPPKKQTAEVLSLLLKLAEGTKAS